MSTARGSASRHQKSDASRPSTVALPAIVVADDHSRIACPGPAKLERRFRGVFPQTSIAYYVRLGSRLPSKTGPCESCPAAAETSQVFGCVNEFSIRMKENPPSIRQHFPWAAGSPRTPQGSRAFRQQRRFHSVPPRNIAHLLRLRLHFNAVETPLPHERQMEVRRYLFPS